MPTLADCLTDAERASLRSIPAAEEAAERAAVQATVAAQGWKDCEGSDTLQCGCGRTASAGQFLSRRLAQGRGTRVTMCRQCAERQT